MSSNFSLLNVWENKTACWLFFAITSKNYFRTTGSFAKHFSYFYPLWYFSINPDELAFATLENQISAVQQSKPPGLQQPFEESTDSALLSSLCDDLPLHITVFK